MGDPIHANHAARFGVFELDTRRPSIHVVQNWYEEFRDREQD